MKILKHTQTMSETSLALNGADIVDLLKINGAIPREAKAEVKFRVPGGGDYSNCTLEVSDADPIVVSYKEFSEVES